MSSAVADWKTQLGLDTRCPPVFIANVDEIDRQARLLHAHTIRRAWHDLGLNGILTLDGVPTVYFKQLDDASATALRDLQRRFWNHGVAVLLLVITSDSVLVFSSLTSPPSPDEDVEANERLVATLSRTADALALRRLLSDVETGSFFQSHARSFDPSKRVDRHLLDNLDAARTRLLETRGALPLRTIHSLLGRLVFTCYLFDRGIIDEQYVQEQIGLAAHSLKELLAQDQPAHYLYKLFKQLRADFNGDLFAADLDTEEASITTSHLAVIRRLLNGDDLRTGQASLGFWPYDFSVLPIEMISGIYDRFLQAEDQRGKKGSGAYYTPHRLAEVVLDLALESRPSLQSTTLLDPACGSGVFLVGFFNRLADEWRRSHSGVGEKEKAASLLAMLQSRIFGADINPTACRIAAFSLYVAFLDQLTPTGIRELQRHGQILPPLIDHNIVCGDYFLPNALDGLQYDVVVGNPPWVVTKGPRSSAEVWAKQHGVPLPQRQVAFAFVEKAKASVASDGWITFLLPVGLLLNHNSTALAYQKFWLTNADVERIINLGDLSFFLFPGAIRPAIVVKYRSRGSVPVTRIDYVATTSDYRSLRADVLCVASDPRIPVIRADLISELKRESPPLVWKVAIWGTPRDLKFLSRLNDYERLKDRIHDEYGLREGFNPYGHGQPIDRPVLRRLPYRPTETLQPFVVTTDGLKAAAPVTSPHRCPPDDVFMAPHVLMPHGVPRTGDRRHAAFCGTDCSFQHGVRAIHLDSRDAEPESRLLACVLSSRLALYYFFHTSASWGMERPKISRDEESRFPFPRATTQMQRVARREIVAWHRHLERRLLRSSPLSDSWAASEATQIDQLVASYYEVGPLEAMLIDDTVSISIPSATPQRRTRTIPAVELIEPADQALYAKTLVEVLRSWGAKDGPIVERVYQPADQSLGLVTLRRTGRAATRHRLGGGSEIDATMRRLSGLLEDRKGSTVARRSLLLFDGDSLHLLKPLNRHFWTRTAAINDADRIAAAALAE